jgi:tRNA modification GTPase
MSSTADTIVATATPPGRGGIGIVRLSGPDTARIAESIIGRLPAARFAERAQFRGAEGELLDEGLALYFPGPNSYTGEAVLELHGHGGPWITEALVARALSLGARRAQPGEFTQRAYLNDKLDLAQAEAVADLIDARSDAAARAALRSLQGAFSERVRALDEALAQLRAHVEATIDFPTDEIDFLAEDKLAGRLAAVGAQCAALQATARQGRLLTEGLTVVIAGAPNAGKSTLLNRLAGHEAAIVSETPGTTRDLLREQLQIGGVPLLLLDTAGLRESVDAIESEGVRRARAAIAQADHVLFLVDAATDPKAQSFDAERARLPAQVPVTLIYNKQDLLPKLSAGARTIAGVGSLAISALTGEGLDELKAHLLDAAGYRQEDSGTLSARRRHLEALSAAAARLEAAEIQCRKEGAAELVAEELRNAQRALGEITGAGTADELLGRIFASFCIGK